MDACRYDHTCRDRDGYPIAGTDKVCHAEARAQLRDVSADPALEARS